MKRKMLCAPVMGIAVLATLVALASASDEPQKHIKAMMDAMNEELEAMGEPFRVASVEYYTDATQPGQIVYCDDRAKQMGIRWVPGDPRRDERTDITWCSDLVDGTANGLTKAETQAAISSAMATWTNVRCSDIPLVMKSDLGMDWGFYQFLWAWLGGGYGGGPPSIYFDIDIAHAGCLPEAFFDWLFGAGTSDYILAVAFTFYWPTDNDNNGKFDTAFVEIYYNNKFPWAWGIDVEYPWIDFESVALHEAGHALSQGHFGRIFRTEANGKLHFAPLAVMNAAYTGPLQQLTGTDLAGHCSIWAAWPNK